MVLLNTLFALFFLCISLSLVIIVGSKKDMNTLFGLLLMALSSIILLSISELSAENVIFVIFGLLTLSIMFAFQIRDNLILSIKSEDTRSDNDG